VVLMDEIEKAHPDVFNILLQVMDEGRLTDNLNHTVDFRNVVLILTSNIGSEMLKDGTSLGFQATSEEMDYQKMKSQLMDEVKKKFRPEFLNSVDEIIVFRSLVKRELKEIMGVMLEEIKDRLKEYELELEVASEVKDFLIGKGYDPIYGARPLRRAIQKLIEDPLAEKILKGKISSKSKIKVVVKNGKLKFASVPFSPEKSNKNVGAGKNL
jgi:ATP-dependent Clp protease ATP-binding subunit ClpC